MPARFGRLIPLVLVALGAACHRSDLEPTRDRPRPVDVTAATLPPATPSSSAACERKIHRLLAAVGRQAPKDIDTQRLRVLRSAKAEPVVFVRPPRADPEACEGSRRRARVLARAARPAEPLGRLLQELRAQPNLVRQILLREGYLWADSPGLARALVDRVEPHQLFTERRVWIQRGQRTGWAVRGDDGRYVWEDGPERGRVVRLILFDRLGLGVPPPALHRDLRELRYRLHFDRARLRHVGEDRVVAELLYGEHWVPTLLASAGARLELECEAPAWTAASAVAETRMRAARRERALRALRRSLLARIEKAAPAEEPGASEVLLAGAARPSWAVFERSMFHSVAQLGEVGASAGKWFETEDDAQDSTSGDVLVVGGRAVFVYEHDPISGEPIAVVDTSARPAIRVWRGAGDESARRIRPTLEWLEASVPALEDPLLVPPPLVAGRPPG